VGGQEYVLLQSVLCQLCKSGIGSVSMFWGCINNCIVKENIIILEFITYYNISLYKISFF
jgi:hypothetical protein